MILLIIFLSMLIAFIPSWSLFSPSWKYLNVFPWKCRLAFTSQPIFCPDFFPTNRYLYLRRIYLFLCLIVPGVFSKTVYPFFRTHANEFVGMNICKHNSLTSISWTWSLNLLFLGNFRLTWLLDFIFSDGSDWFFDWWFHPEIADSELSRRISQ